MTVRYLQRIGLTHVLLVLFVVNLPVVSGQEDNGRAETGHVIPAEEQPFWDSAQRFVDAYADRDVAAIADMFTENAEFLDEFGVLTEGREAISAMFASVFESNDQAMIDEIKILRIRYLSNNVVMEEGYVVVSASPDEPRHQSRYVALHTKEKDGQWRINSLKDFPREPMGRHEQLSQLAWMIGDWVNEDTETVVHTTCDWSPDGNYLLRHFNMQHHDGRNLSGVQRIGWDPAMKKLRSWTFDSKGGFFRGLWTQNGRQWLLNLNGVTAEGEPVTATSVFRVIDSEMVTWNYENLIVGGEVRGATEPITMVKRPPAPQRASK